MLYLFNVTRMGKQFIFLRLMDLFVCLLHYKIRPSGNSGRSMDFGIRQIYLNLNLSSFEGIFDFGQVIFIPLNLGLCVHHRVVIRIERKKNIYN